MRTARWTIVVLGGLAVLATALPLAPSNNIAIRLWDFPRLQIAALLASVLMAVPCLMPTNDWRSWVFGGTLVTALAWQLLAIAPYTPLAATEAKAIDDCPADQRISLLISNVYIANREVAPLLDVIRRLSPAVVLLVETDGWWDKQLGSLNLAYPHAIRHPRSDSYGMHLFSKFPLVAPQVRFLLEDYVPSIKTGLRLPSGARIDFYGLHPKPPPLQNTKRRDAELLLVGKELRNEPTSSIVAGDLNDVAWSRTSSLFREISGLLDPRKGRGLYATFNADWLLLRWPLDHVFFEVSFRLLELAVMGDIGSDHFPFYVALCHAPLAPDVQEQPQPEPADARAAKEAIEDGREAGPE